jgi:hypothetical protein
MPFKETCAVEERIALFLSTSVPSPRGREGQDEGRSPQMIALGLYDAVENSEL